MGFAQGIRIGDSYRGFAQGIRTGDSHRGFAQGIRIGIGSTLSAILGGKIGIPKIPAHNPLNTFLPLFMPIYSSSSPVDVSTYTLW